MANIEAKNPDQLMIRDLVESYGMKISAKRAPGHICAVSTLEAIYKKYGYQVLNRVLRLIIATWEGDSNSFSANIMNAVAKLCVVYGAKAILSVSPAVAINLFGRCSRALQCLSSDLEDEYERIYYRERSY